VSYSYRAATSGFFFNSLTGGMGGRVNWATGCTASNFSAELVNTLLAVSEPKAVDENSNALNRLDAKMVGNRALWYIAFVTGFGSPLLVAQKATN
jgi:hypothetical protein